MRITLLVLLGLVTAAAFADSYSTDFEGDTPGTLPAGWTVATPWGDWAPGPIMASVEAGPTGGQAVKIVWGTDWASYGASSGELDFTMAPPLDPQKAILTYEYDFWKVNWGIWQVTGDQTWFPPGGLHMNDNPELGTGHMFVGRDGPAPPDLTDVPEGAWVHVVTTFNSASDVWETAVSYGGGGGGAFGGVSTNDIVGQWFFGGWAFKSTMDSWGGNYDNVVYIDNFSMSVTPVPEPATVFGFASVLGLLALRRRK